MLIVDAVTMTEIGRAYVPISIPFGFHNRFFSKKDLGLPEGFHVNQFRPTVPVPVGVQTAQTQTHPLPDIKPSTHSQLPTPTSAKPHPSPLPPSPITQKPNPNGWSRITVGSTSTRIIPTRPITSPKPPKWLPVSATSEIPWWKRVQSTDRPRTIRPSSIERISTPKTQPTFGTTRFPSPATLRPVTTEMPAPSPSPNVVSPETPETPSAMRELYDETIKALCRWLPRVFKTISSDVCIENSQKAVK